MADLRVFAKQRSAQRGKDGDWVNLRATRDGAPIVLPWYQALVMEGHVYQVIAPSPMDATGLTLATSYADTTKTLYVDIPDSNAAIPVDMQAVFLATGAAVDHVLMFVSPTLNGTGGTETAVTPVNLALDKPNNSGATAAHTATGEADVVTANEVLLKRWATNQDLDATSIQPDIVWTIGQWGYAPVVIDAGSLNLVQIATTSGTGFAIITWINLDESWIL